MKIHWVITATTTIKNLTISICFVIITLLAIDVSTALYTNLTNGFVVFHHIKLYDNNNKEKEKGVFKPKDNNKRNGTGYRGSRYF